MRHLNISVDQMTHLIHMYNIQTHRLPGSKEESLSRQDMNLMAEFVQRVNSAQTKNMGGTNG
jgi:hypothetical protein